MQWKIKRYGKREQTQILRGSANRVYVHASKLIELDYFTKQASKASTTLTIGF